MIECFTDASYSKEVGGSVIGYKIGDSPIVTDFCENIKNTQAEVLAVRKCIEKCKEDHPDHQIHVYTDCQKVMMMDFEQDIIFHKMIGHMKNSEKDDKQLIFTQVDRMTRKVLRQRIRGVREQKGNN